jgi:hypothetical protein
VTVATAVLRVRMENTGVGMGAGVILSSDCSDNDGEWEMLCWMVGGWRSSLLAVSLGLAYPLPNFILRCFGHAGLAGGRTSGNSCHFSEISGRKRLCSSSEDSYI